MVIEIVECRVARIKKGVTEGYFRPRLVTRSAFIKLNS